MSLLAEIRAEGGCITIAPGGALVAKDVPAALLELAKPKKETILATLREEALYGEQYRDSRYFVMLETLYNHVTAVGQTLIVKELCDELRQLLFEIDDAFYLSITGGCNAWMQRWPQVSSLIERIDIKRGVLLTGHRLREAVAEVFPATDPTLNLAALD